MRPWEEARPPLGLTGGKAPFLWWFWGRQVSRSSLWPLTRAGAAQGSRKSPELGVWNLGPRSESSVLMGKTVPLSNGASACPANLTGGWDGKPWENTYGGTTWTIKICTCVPRRWSPSLCLNQMRMVLWLEPGPVCGTWDGQITMGPQEKLKGIQIQDSLSSHLLRTWWLLLSSFLQPFRLLLNWPVSSPPSCRFLFSCSCSKVPEMKGYNTTLPSVFLCLSPLDDSSGTFWVLLLLSHPGHFLLSDLPCHRHYPIILPLPWGNLLFSSRSSQNVTWLNHAFLLVWRRCPILELLW